MKEFRKAVFKTLEFDPADSWIETFVDYFLIGLIILNVLAVILETVEGFAAPYKTALYLFDLFSVTVFTVEYVLRLWSCTANHEFQQPIRGRIRYALQPLIIVDLVAIMPFYLPLVFPLDLRILRVLRLLRLLRVFKLGRYSQAMNSVGRVLRSRKEEILVTFYVGFILLILAAGLLYVVEHEAQPGKFANIPAAMWWGVTTLTSVGYGDIYPITTLGKVIASFISVIGIGLFALPAGIIASGFAEDIRKRKSKENVCPHCGKQLE